MISADPDDRHGAGRWRRSHAGRAVVDRDLLARGVAGDLLACYAPRSGQEPLVYERFFALIAPVLIEVFWLTDRVAALEKQITAQHGRHEKLVRALGGLPGEPPAAPQSKEEINAE